MVIQNYQKFMEMSSNMIYIVALVVGFKCPRKIHLNTQWGGGGNHKSTNNAMSNNGSSIKIINWSHGD